MPCEKNSRISSHKISISCRKNVSFSTKILLKATSTLFQPETGFKSTIFLIRPKTPEIYIRKVNLTEISMYFLTSLQHRKSACIPQQVCNTPDFYPTPLRKGPLDLSTHAWQQKRRTANRSQPSLCSTPLTILMLSLHKIQWIYRFSILCHLKIQVCTFYRIVLCRLTQISDNLFGLYIVAHRNRHFF